MVTIVVRIGGVARKTYEAHGVFTARGRAVELVLRGIAYKIEVGVGEALSRKAVVFEMLLRDAIVGTYIELVLLVESLRIAHGQVATEQIVFACAIGIRALAEHTTGGLIYFGVERRVLGRQEVVGRATGVGDT